MGPVNMMALEEYTETATRHTFLETQRKDLIESIENTQASIKEIDEVSREKFDQAFKVINENFSLTFSKLFGGGQAFMRLTDEINAAESGIDIVASPPGKKLQNILLLSGGEKALTALSLLVGIFQFQPAPFCILDEVGWRRSTSTNARPLRPAHRRNGGDHAQFVVITHSKRTMEQADVMYGVTMQEPGVSKIVSVRHSAAAGRNSTAHVALTCHSLGLTWHVQRCFMRLPPALAAKMMRAWATLSKPRSESSLQFCAALPSSAVAALRSPITHAFP